MARWLGIVIPLMAAVLCWPPRRAGVAAVCATATSTDAATSIAGPDPVGLRWASDDAVRPEPAAGTPAAETAVSVAVAVELLALALTSGVPLTVALEAVAGRSGPIVAAQLRQVSAALQWGVEGAKAWEGLPRLWQPVGAAIALAAQVGMPAAGLLGEAASNIRAQEQQLLQERTARLGVLIVLPLGGCFLPAFAALTVLPVVGVIAAGVLRGGLG